MALFIACNCSRRAVFATFVALAVVVADAGSWKSMQSFSARSFPWGLEVAKMMLDDTWVDLQITSNSQSVCENMTDVRGNGSSGAHAGFAGSKSPLVAAGVGAKPSASPSGVTSQLPQMAASRNQGPLAIETQAVALSLKLEHSCAKSGSRQSLQNSYARPRELRPITITFRDSPASKRLQSSHMRPRELRPIYITFRDSHESKLVPAAPLASNAPPITSLRHFDLAHA